MSFSLVRYRLELLIVAVFLLASWIVYHHQPLGCRYCDTRGYLEMGADYAHRGVLSEIIMTNEQTGEPFEASQLRLYAYPLFIAGLVGTADLTGLPLWSLVFAAQLAVYLGAALWLAAILRRHAAPGLGVMALAGLLLNALVYPYFGTPLSDSLSLGCELLEFCLLASLFFCQPGRHYRLTVAALGTLAGLTFGLALMIRPGNLYMVLFGSLALLALVGLHRSWTVALALPAAALGFAVAVAPQLWFNIAHYHEATFMPVSKLGQFQLDAGRGLLKYATWTKSGGTGIYYGSPWGAGPEKGLAWYWHHKLNGLKTLLMHVFGMLDFEYYTPYVDQVQPRRELLLLFISQTLVYWAVWGWFRALCRWHSARRAEQARPLLFALFASAVFVVSWLGIYALTAGENRFAMPLMVLAGPWAAWGLSRKIDWRQAAALAGFVVYLLLAHHAAGLLDGLRRVPPGS